MRPSLNFIVTAARPKYMLLVLLVIFCFSSSAQTDTARRPVIDEFASFPGGAEKFFDYIRTNLKYPQDALRDSISGDVFVQFTVSPDGSIPPETVRVSQSLSPSCDNEAVRLIKNAPKWMPARSEGKPIEQQITFPVSFRLEN